MHDNLKVDETRLGCAGGAGRGGCGGRRCKTPQGAGDAPIFPCGAPSSRVGSDDSRGRPAPAGGGAIDQSRGGPIYWELRPRPRGPFLPSDFDWNWSHFVFGIGAIPDITASFCELFSETTVFCKFCGYVECCCWRRSSRSITRRACLMGTPTLIARYLPSSHSL